MSCVSFYSEGIPFNAYPPFIMTSSSIYPEESGASLPEVLWLEPHHFAQARELGRRCSSEALQWQDYANALAFVGFNQWLDKKGHSSVESPMVNFTESVCQFKVGEFKLCLVAGERVSNETVYIPQATIFKPELAAHFYIALEVSQEEEQVILRGVLQYDQLTHYLRQEDRLPTLNGFYPIPLSLFDPELNHLLSYFRYLDTSAIPLPISLVDSSEIPSISKIKLRKSLKSTNIHLKNWLQDFS
jgi:Protein of unknown function (DUF1822)